MRYLTKSRFKQALECPDKLYYSGKKDEYADAREENEFLRELAKGGMQVGELAKCYFPGGIEVETLDIDAALATTRDLMQQENVTIFEAAVAHGNLLVRVDVLEKKGKVINLYEAKSKSYFSEDEIFTKKGKRRIASKWKPYVYDIAFQVYVSRKAFPDSTVNGSLFLINKNAICSVDGLFQKFLVRKVGRRYKVSSNPAVEIGNQILGKLELDDTINEILEGSEELGSQVLTFENYVKALGQSFADQTKMNIPVSTQCKGCEYKANPEDKLKGLKSGYEECWMAKAHLKAADFTKNHIFEIWNLRIGDDLIAQRRYFINDLTAADFPAQKKVGKFRLGTSERQWVQVERIHNPRLGPYHDGEGLKAEFSKLKYPLHFIDFEATQNAIPYLKGLRPYEQLAFQFSHHILDETGKVIHAGEWIDTQRGHYPNFDFIRNLKKQLDGDNGSVLIYSSFENSVLNRIHDTLNGSVEPDRAELMDFIKTIAWWDSEEKGFWSGPRKMVDLREWVMNYYWSPVMKGSNSIKAVLPAIIGDSKFVQMKYSDWIKPDGMGGFVNPYKLLSPVFDKVDNMTFFRLMEEDEIADGGAAMCAFNLMQFAEMEVVERSQITKCLLEYCKLDTLAMAMLFEGLGNFGKG